MTIKPSEHSALRNGGYILGFASFRPQNQRRNKVRTPKQETLTPRPKPRRRSLLNKSKYLVRALNDQYKLAFGTPTPRVTVYSPSGKKLPHCRRPVTTRAQQIADYTNRLNLIGSLLAAGKPAGSKKTMTGIVSPSYGHLQRAFTKARCMISFNYLPLYFPREAGTHRADSDLDQS